MKKKLKGTVLRFQQRIPGLWEYSAIKQLKFKFAALKFGIQENRLSKTNLFNLRRDIHRLEKGLSYPTAKPVFATDYIAQTVENFCLSLRKGSLDEDTKNWAFSVLNLYFNIVDATQSPVVSNAKIQFHEAVRELSPPDNIPYPSSLRPKSSITYEELLNLSVRRRSIRYFRDEPASLEIVRKAYEIAKYAPSACNRQAFQFLYFDEPETVKRLAAIPGGVAGYNVPSIIVVVGRYDGYFDIRDINAPVIDSSLAIMSFLYAAETLGLGTVCINWPNLIDREQKIRKVIDLHPFEFVVMMIGVGYPLDNGKVPFSGKRPSNQVILGNERIKIR
mgnify:CR=1 FL=1|jgi:Nitroreductase